MEKRSLQGRRSWSRRRMRSSFCMPMMKGGSSSACGRKTNLSLLDRLRDAVLRLIMLSALSKAAATAPPPPQERKWNNAQRCSGDYREYHQYARHYHEPHRSEALADCIEFIKKSATATAADVEISGAAAQDDAAGSTSRM